MTCVCALDDWMLVNGSLAAAAAALPLVHSRLVKPGYTSCWFFTLLDVVKMRVVESSNVTIE